MLINSVWLFVVTKCGDFLYGLSRILDIFPSLFNEFFFLGVISVYSDSFPDSRIEFPHWFFSCVVSLKLPRFFYLITIIIDFLYSVCEILSKILIFVVLLLAFRIRWFFHFWLSNFLCLYFVIYLHVII